MTEGKFVESMYESFFILKQPSNSTLAHSLIGDEDKCKIHIYFFI